MPPRGEDDDRKRGQGERERPRPAVRRDLFRLHPTEVPDTASTVLDRIAVEHLLPETAERDADTVVVARDRCAVAGDQDDVVRRSSPPQVAGDALIHIREVDPLKSLRVGVPLVEGGLPPVQPV